MTGFTNFDKIAPFYDTLSGLIFGNKLKDVQLHSLEFISPGSIMLIAGGGTGWILEALSGLHPSGLEITYVDSSSEMIRISGKRNYKKNKVEFINAPIEQVKLKPQSYDVILTPFLLDCFTQPELETVFKNINTSLKGSGIWIDMDFQITSNSTRWQKILIRTMYSFFRLTCKMKANTLPNISNYFSSFELVNQTTYYRSFITFHVYRKI
ncbi:MAG: class I SAM-dependent methyltransferase [Bacteroidia bacterium]